VQQSSECRHGVLAFGDSITNGGGELQWGVALQSWALWVARALGLPFTGYAVDGAGVSDVVRSQIPAYEARAASPGARYDVGCLYIGVNDVRRLNWDGEAFAADHLAALAFLTARCDRTLAITAPLRLGVPPAGAKVSDCNAVIERNARRQRALIVDLSDFGARNHVMADRVHPTAFGQVAIAERALAALDRDGLQARVQPASMISFETTRVSRVRADWAYAYRSAKLHAGAGLRRLAARAAPDRPGG
jgi:lysophospholipase L1-like esterase